MNLLQNIVNAVMGENAFQVAELDINIQMVCVIFMICFVYLALRSMARFFLQLGNKF